MRLNDYTKHILAESRYSQSEMSRAARLLDDEMQYEI